MRHCIGDKSMGYIQALSDSEVEIWSLRSQAGKPRFTLEIDPDDGSVLQLKGKANRTPGFAAKDDTEIRFPEEVVFWEWLLRRLDIDPYQVADFDALRSSLPAQRMTANPSSRSFNRPFVEVA